jgi:hypothetical protein
MMVKADIHMKYGIFLAASMSVSFSAQAATSILEQLSPSPTAYVHGQDYGIPGIAVDDTIIFGPRFVDITSQIADVSGSGINGLSAGCSAGDYGSGVAGKIALVGRGGCQFVEKALAAQQAGALAVLIADDDPSTHTLDMGGFNPLVSITAFRVSYDLGALLANQALVTPTTVRLALGNDLVSSLPAVPEPSTWAMMILGFGMTGGVIRFRKPVRSRTPKTLVGE